MTGNTTFYPDDVVALQVPANQWRAAAVADASTSNAAVSGSSTAPGSLPRQTSQRQLDSRQALLDTAEGVILTALYAGRPIEQAINQKVDRIRTRGGIQNASDEAALRISLSRFARQQAER